ncbi:Gfo/Idh/MocA family protein [Jeotgalibacillus campisalis]|uniref:Dehydrogenase n=1 Tax=Jeotgalibacillus campisalis TaxID=220754 RepID=A0A0C2RMS3_9BACL|nr:Gfo/Idh/MocA family oxidoreductase [Jeotgalibacillus campisalis]KIL43054.1 dehydrogenase [Jeotgalibacillus campisalis]
MDKIKAGVIGTGFIGPAHVEAVRRLGFVEVVALAASSLEKAKMKAEQLDIPHAYGDYREMLLDPTIQVVHNCTPNYLHHEISMEIIKAGKHVLSEKPLAVSCAESFELLNLAREKRIVHGVNFNYRQFPSVQNLQHMVENGSIGSVHLIHGSYLQDWLLNDTDYDWRLDPKLGGKTRAVADIGSHWCDTVQFVTGKRITSVFADMTTVLPIRKKRISADSEDYEEYKVETEDHASVLLRFHDGTKGVFTVSQISAGRKNRLSFEMNGSLGSAFWNQEEPEKLWVGHREKSNDLLLADSTLFTPEARSSIHHPGGHNEGWPDALKNMMLNFYSYIKEGKDPLKDKPNFATFEDGHASMCVIDAILESHEQEKWVEVKTS